MATNNLKWMPPKKKTKYRRLNEEQIDNNHVTLLGTIPAFIKNIYYMESKNQDGKVVGMEIWHPSETYFKLTPK